jgi:hypothetical protein
MSSRVVVHLETANHEDRGIVTPFYISNAFQTVLTEGLNAVLELGGNVPDGGQLYSYIEKLYTCGNNACLPTIASFTMPLGSCRFTYCDVCQNVMIEVCEERYKLQAFH